MKKRKVRQCPDKPGSVSPRAESFVIYLICKSPCSSSVLPSIVAFREASGRQPYHDDGIRELAASRRHSLDGHPPAGGLLHHLLTLAHADFPGIVPDSIRRGRLFSSAFTCRHQQLPFSEVERLMLPGLSSRATFMAPATSRGTVLQYHYNIYVSNRVSYIISAAKLIKTFIKQGYYHSILHVFAFTAI